MANERVIVLGAGLQGVCSAMALAQRGFRVTLVEQAPDCLLRASLRNEGKIHLGLVYAHDSTFRTASLMLRSALAFSSLIDEWTGGRVPWDAIRSRPFTYVIARNSMMSPVALFDHYEKVQRAWEELLRDGASNYLGARPERLWRESAATDVPGLDPSFAAAAMTTSEVALDLVEFRQVLRARLHDLTGIERLYGHRVASVVRTSSGFRVEGSLLSGETWMREAGIVVNCLWEARLLLDEQMNFLPRRTWMHRLKYRVLGELPEEMRHLTSLTLVLGRYGDVVVYPSRRIYLSWYSACMRDHAASIAIPPAWESACNGEVSESDSRSIAGDTLSGFESVVPGISAVRVDQVDAGVIVAWGESDINDPQSELHERFDIGVRAIDGYYSIDTGKLTCAPLFARHLVDAIAQ